MTKQQHEALHQAGEPQKELMQKLCENSTAQLWLSYCDKKMECEDLREDLDAAKARITELEAALAQRVPLALYQRDTIKANAWRETVTGGYYDANAIIDATEAAHGITQEKQG